MIDAFIALLGGQANTVSFAIFGGVIGFLGTGTYNLWIARRKDKLERVNQQLRLLYGPLYSLVYVSTNTWVAFVMAYCKNADFETESGGLRPQSPEAEVIWRHWMSSVFIPLNLQMAKLVIENADLLEDKGIPNCLQKLSTHIHGYQGILAAWEKGDYSRHMSLTSFPGDEVMSYAKDAYLKLEARQAKLIGNT